MSHFMARFLLRLAISRAHATDAILSHFLPTCHPFDTINRITCHEAFMRDKKSGFKVVGKDGVWCVSAQVLVIRTSFVFPINWKTKRRGEGVTGKDKRLQRRNKRVDIGHSLSQSRHWGDKGVFANKFVALMREKGRRTYCLIGVSIKVWSNKLPPQALGSCKKVNWNG